jgi:tetratricopeptide (TPR) repeat protein
VSHRFLRRTAAGAALALALVVTPRPPSAQPTRPAPPAVDYDDQDDRKSDFWERALDPASERYDGLVERAATLLRETDRDSLTQAGQLLRDAIRLVPDRPLAHLWSGRLADRLGDHAGCARSIAKALDLSPELDAPGGTEPTEWAAHYELAVCRARSGKYEAAIEGLRRILGRAHGREVAIYQRLGECYMALGRLDEAVEAFRQGIRLSPYSAELGFGLAVAHDRDDDAAQSRDAMQSALGRDPRAGSLVAVGRIWIPPVDAPYYLGLAALGMEDHPRAVLHFRRYLAAAGEGAWSRRARAHYEEALAGAVAGRGLAVRGSATIDQARAGAVIGKADGGLQACLRKAPDLIVRVSITAVVPIKGKAADTTGAVKPGVRVLIQEPSDSPSADVRAAIGCAEAVARRVALPRPTGAPGTYITAEFDAVAR